MSVDWHTVVVPVILFLSTCTRSTFGFGDALVGMPLLAMAVGVKIAAPLIALVSVTIAAAVVLKDWRSIHFKSACPLVLASFAGIPIGIFFLTEADERIVKLILAVTVLAFAMFALTRPRLFVIRTDKPALPFGFVAGILGGAYNAPGLLLVVYGTLRRWSAEQFRATLQGYFLPTSLLILFGYGLRGLWVPDVFRYYLVSLPLIVPAILLGKTLNKRFQHRSFVFSVYVMLIVIGIMLLIEVGFP